MRTREIRLLPNLKRQENSRKKDFHEPVLYQPALENLKVKAGKKYIDATAGGGGHTKGILELGAIVLAIDTDPDSINYLAGRFGLTLTKKSNFTCAISSKITLVQDNFVNLGRIAKNFGFKKVDGILFDLGVSSFQLEKVERGFSLKREGPLDMRMNPALSVTAADLINGLNKGELYELFTNYGEERFSRRLASAIVQSRIKKKIETTTQLAELIERAIGRRGKVHPATKIFLALRIAVNDELNNLKVGLLEAVKLLSVGGRLVLISFHSLEDRVIKNFLKEREDLKVITKKPIRPSREEILSNPRSRSAKMRVAEKV